MRALYVRKRGRHDGAELGVESARTVRNVEMSTVGRLGIGRVRNPDIATIPFLRTDSEKALSLSLKTRSNPVHASHLAPPSRPQEGAVTICLL